MLFHAFAISRTAWSLVSSTFVSFIFNLFFRACRMSASSPAITFPSRLQATASESSSPV